MSRVLLVGAGPLPGPGQRRIGFPQLRTASLAGALRAGGHEVALACLRWDEHGPPTDPGPHVSEARDIRAERGTWIEDLRSFGHAWRPDAWVAAGPYAPPRAAALAVGDEPLWVDVPGDPFAEAQALAARLDPRGEPLPSPPGAAQTVAFAAALARGDAFSACSEPQAHALLGQLGLAGRLARTRPTRRWVELIPPAWDFGLPEGVPRRRVPQGPLCVALVGGFNAWFDDTTIAEGLLLAMDRGLPLQVVVVGGAIDGHFTAGWTRFVARVTASPHAARFDLRGWVPQGELPAALASAHLLLSADLPGAEPTLGSRTRLLFGLHQGLELLASTGPELAAGLATEGFLHPLTPGSEGLAEALAARFEAGGDGARVAEAQRVLRVRHAPAALGAPLARWAQAPDRAPAGADRAETLSARIAALEAEIAAIRGSPTWRVLNRVHLLLRRLTGRR
jgi:hypothetical protein